MSLTWLKKSAHSRPRSDRAETKLKAIFSAHEKQEHRQKPFRNFFRGSSRSAVSLSTQIAVGDISQLNIENGEQVADPCQQQWPLKDQPEPLALVTPLSSDWPLLETPNTRFFEDSTSSNSSSTTINLMDNTSMFVPGISHLVFSMAPADTSITNTTRLKPELNQSTQRPSVPYSLYSKSEHASNQADKAGPLKNQKESLVLLQQMTSYTTRECLKAKEILQWYDAQEILFNLSAPDIQELHNVFCKLYQPICDLHAIVKKIDSGLGNGLADSRAECTLAQADIVLARTPPSDTVGSIHDQSMDRAATLSDLGYVIEKLMKLLHRIPMKLILPHVNDPESPIVSNPSSPWVKNENASVKHRHAIVVSSDGNNFHQTVFKTSMGLRNDRLDIVTPEVASAICADIFHFTIMMEGSNGPQSSPVRWTAASAPGAVSIGHMTVRHIRKHVSDHLNLPQYAFEFWAGDNKLENGGDEVTLLSWTHNVITIVLDPVIDVVVNGTGSISIDFSEEAVNKAFVPIGQIKKKIRSMLGAEDDKPLSLYLVKHELTEDSTTLWETGMLSIQQAEGFSQIHLRADFNRPKKTCITCLEDKYTSRFPFQVTSTCTHDINICKPCLRHWIDEKLNSTGMNIPCPECNQAMGYEDVRRCAKKPQFERYVSFPLFSAIYPFTKNLVYEPFRR
jgi:hypothetical protein